VNKSKKSSRLDANVLVNMDILYKYTAGVNFYRHMTVDGDFNVTSLPRPDYFNRLEGIWKFLEQDPTGWEQQPPSKHRSREKKGSKIGGKQDQNSACLTNGADLASTQAWGRMYSLPSHYLYHVCYIAMLVLILSRSFLLLKIMKKRKYQKDFHFIFLVCCFL
jgi:hypothetical protein